MELYCEFMNFSSLNAVCQAAKEILVFSTAKKAFKESKPTAFKTTPAPVLDLLA